MAGHQAERGNEDATGRGPDIAVFPPAVSVAAPLLAAVLEWVAPLGILPPAGTPWMLAAGLVLSALAGGLAIAGERAFRRAGTNVNPRRPALRVVRDGPYRFTRNPMYLGMVILQFGLALVFSLDWALLGGVAVWAILHFGVVLPEERYLEERFGEDYRALKRQTRRWL